MLDSKARSAAARPGRGEKLTTVVRSVDVLTPSEVAGRHGSYFFARFQTCRIRPPPVVG
jgi:hypothetical protein